MAAFIKEGVRPRVDLGKPGKTVRSLESAGVTLVNLGSLKVSSTGTDSATNRRDRRDQSIANTNQVCNCTAKYCNGAR